MGQRKKSLSIFWYMIELCVLQRGKQLPLQSETRFSSYKGPKVGFDTFLAISLCVYIGAHNDFRTECTSSRGHFWIKTVMSSINDIHQWLAYTLPLVENSGGSCPLGIRSRGGICPRGELSGEMSRCKMSGGTVRRGNCLVTPYDNPSTTNSLKKIQQRITQHSCCLVVRSIGCHFLNNLVSLRAIWC